MTDQADTGPIREWLAAAAAATDGPWYVTDNAPRDIFPSAVHPTTRGEYVQRSVMSLPKRLPIELERRVDADFIAASRNVVPAVRALVAELAAARDQIAAVTNERNRLAIIARQLMHGLTPKAEAERLIAAALSQSGQPTKETP